MEEVETAFDITEILRLLPHRYPFLLVDKVVEFEDNSRIVALKNVTFNEQFFQGHFPNRPVMPGVLVLEALAQTAAILAHKSSNGIPQTKQVLLVGADNFRWKRQVLPGDTLYLEAKFNKKKGPLWLMDTVAKTQSGIVAQGGINACEVEA